MRGWPSASSFPKPSRAVTEPKEPRRRERSSKEIAGVNPEMCSLFDMTSLLSVIVAQFYSDIRELVSRCPGHPPRAHRHRQRSPPPHDEQPVDTTSIDLSKSISCTTSDPKSNRGVSNLERAFISLSFALLPYLAHSYPDWNVHHIERTELSDCRRAGRSFR